MRRSWLIVIGTLLSFVLVACGSAELPPAETPQPPRLDEPRSAVESYLDWVSYAYRVADSAPASPTMTAEELVRVDAYIQQNRLENRGIEQEVTSFEQRALDIDGKRASLAASEEWEYRYFTLEPLAYSSEPAQASYETTYSLVLTEAGWVVDDIEVETVGTVE